MSYTFIAQKLLPNVSDEGEIEVKMSNRLFSSFNDQDIWTPIEIDCAMPKSSFYIAKVKSNLSLININANDDLEEKVYLILRYTEDDIKKYIDYLKIEYRSYMSMEEQVNEIIAPIGYQKRTEQGGFFFAFLASTNLTLENAIDDIKELPLQMKFSYIINLIDSVNEYLIKENIAGFHITPKTILINLQNNKESIGLIDFVGGIDELRLCKTAMQFVYNDKFSPSELQRKITPTILAPNSFSDVYGLAKVVQIIIGDELNILPYKKVMISAFQKNPKNRISINDFKNQMLEVQKEIFSLDESTSKTSTKLPLEQLSIKDPNILDSTQKHLPPSTQVSTQHSKILKTSSARESE